MRKFFFIIMTTLSACIMLASCDNKNNLEEKPEDNEPGVAEVGRSLLYGDWNVVMAKYTQDATMTRWEQKETSFTFNENGLYEGKGYYGDVKGIYTIKGGIITVLIDNVTYAEYKVLAQSEESLTLCVSFTTTPSKVWLQCTKAKYLDLQPDEGTAITIEDMLVTEADVERYYSYIYQQLSSFVRMQLDVEQQIVDNNRIQLTPESQVVEKLWSAGYVVNRVTNVFISALSKIDDSSINYNKEKYIAGAKCVRAFVLYNMNMLWGGIPIVTAEMTTEETTQLGRTSEDEVYNYIINDVKDYTQFIDKSSKYGNKIIAERAINTLFLEIALSNGNADLAADIVERYKNASDEDYFVINYNPESQPLQAAEYLIYSQKKFDLLSQEAKKQTEGTADAWTTQFKYGYGYWAALKRLGVAQDVTHCEGYQLLLPIPKKDLIYMPNLTQNPGY